MPHVAEHIEGEPILDFTGVREAQKPQLDLSGVRGALNVGTEQRYVPENNSIVTMPAGSSASFDTRESREFIDGEEGLYGNTPVGDLFNLLGAPGGLFDAEDIKKLPGGVEEAIVSTVTGGFRESVILSAAKKFPTPSNIEAAIADIHPLVTEGVIDIMGGNFRDGVSKLAEAFGRAKQVAPPDVLTGPFDLVKNLVIQKNPELADRFNAKMLELQSANEDFLVRHGLMFGPNDEPTVVGNLLSQLGLTGAAIGGAVLLKNPTIPAIVFGSVQQVSGFKAAEEVGKDPFTASAIGTAQGIIEGSISFIELGQLIKIVNVKSLSIGSKIAAGMVAEGIEEGVTEALIASVQNLTGVQDMTLNDALGTIFQASFYGSIAGGGVTGTIATVQRMTGGAVSEGDVAKIASIVDGEVSDAAIAITEQAIDDAGVELEIGRDAQSDQTVTKAAKTTAKQQERVVEILQAVNEGKDIDTKALLDDIFPEQRIQREKQRLEQNRNQSARTVSRDAVRERVVEIQAEIQIAEQQGDEEAAATLSEELDRIQQLSFTDENVRAAVDELQAEGIFIPGSEVFETAVAEIDDLLRPLRAGVRVGRALQKEESKALQDSLTNIIDRLVKSKVIDDKTARRLQKKTAKATTIKNAESVRRDILSQARKAAFRKFKKERLTSIKDTIHNLAKKKVGELDPDSQNTIDSMDKMRKGREKARRVEKVDDISIEVFKANDFKNNQKTDDGEFLYHVTTQERAARIKEEGFRVGQEQSMAPGFFSERSKGNIFFTEESGVGFWRDRIEEHLESTTDDEIGELAVVRVRKSDLKKLEIDEIGTNDAAGSDAFKVGGNIPLSGTAQATETRQQQISDFNVKQSNRIQNEMGQGIPTEAVILQVRYLDILNEKTKATPESVAKFEDDLDAFIATGKGTATAADVKDNALMQKARKKLFSNPAKDARADIENSMVVDIADKSINFFLKTHDIMVRILGLKGTVFDLFREDVSWRNEKQLAMEKVQDLAGRISPDGRAYLRELSDEGLFASDVIDVSRKGHTAELGGKQSSRVKWTRGQLVYARMLLEEKSIEEQIRNPDGKMAWTDDFIDLINQKITDQDRAFIEGMFEIYRESYERFNEVYRQVYNRDLTFVEFYSHISREGKDGQDESAHTETVLIDLLNTEGLEDSLIFGPKQPSESITRVDASSEIKIRNVIGVFRNYTYDVEHFIAFAAKLRLQDKLLKDSEFIADMREKLTDNGFDNFIYHVKISARSNKDGKSMERFLVKIFEFFRGAFFKKTLLANPKIGLGQTATAIAAMGEMPTENFMAGARAYLENPGKWGKILDTHPTFARREKNFNPEIDQVGEFGDVLHFLNLSARKGDGFAVRVSGTAIVKYQMEEKGLSKDDAVDVAAEFVEFSQQSTLPTQRTLAQKSDDPLIRSMTMFTSSPVAMANVSMAAIAEYKQSDRSTPKKKAAERAKLNKRLAIQNIYIPMLYATITGRSAATVAGGSLGGAPVIGGVLTVVAQVLLNLFREEDEKVYIKGVIGEIALFESVQDILDAAEKLTKEGVSMADYLDALVPIVELSGLPIGNIRNIAEGAMKLFTTDDPIDAGLQMLDYGEAARKRTRDRLNTIPGVDTDSDSGRVLTQGAF